MKSPNKIFSKSNLFESVWNEPFHGIDMSLLDQDIENLGLEINKLIDLFVTENRKRVRFEDKQKQAVANMSHDLRTPLTSVIGFIQMAEADDITADERKELLSIASKRARRLEEMLKEFFELSLIESTDYPLKTDRMNIKNLTINVVISFYDRFSPFSSSANFDLAVSDFMKDKRRMHIREFIESKGFNLR